MAQAGVAQRAGCLCKSGRDRTRTALSNMSDAGERNEISSHADVMCIGVLVTQW